MGPPWKEGNIRLGVDKACLTSVLKSFCFFSSFTVCRDVLRLLRGGKTFKLDYRLSTLEGHLMQKLWSDEGVKESFQHSKSYQVTHKMTNEKVNALVLTIFLI